MAEFDQFYNKYGSGNSTSKGLLKKIFANPGNYSQRVIKEAYNEALGVDKNSDQFYKDVGSDDEDFVFQQDSYDAAISEFNRGLDDLLLNASEAPNSGNNNQASSDPFQGGSESSNPTSNNLDPRRKIGKFGDIKDVLRDEFSTAKAKANKLANRQPQDPAEVNGFLNKQISIKYNQLKSQRRSEWNELVRQGVSNPLAQLAPLPSLSAFKQEAVDLYNQDVNSFRTALDDKYGIRQQGFNEPSPQQQQDYTNILGGLNEQTDGSVGPQPPAEDQGVAGLNQLLLEQRRGFDEERASSQAQIDALQGRLDTAKSDYEERLAASEERFAASEERFAASQEGFTNTLEAMQLQTQAAQTAYQKQLELAQNQARAFVPQAEQSAMTAQMGDQRQQTRKAKDNNLSSLSILSGLGTSANPLSGLQLA